MTKRQFIVRYLDSSNPDPLKWEKIRVLKTRDFLNSSIHS